MDQLPPRPTSCLDNPQASQSDAHAWLVAAPAEPYLGYVDSNATTFTDRSKRATLAPSARRRKLERRWKKGAAQDGTTSPASARAEARRQAKREKADARKDRMMMIPEIRHATAEELELRHAGYWTRRRQVREAMALAGYPAARLERFDNCGADCSVWVNIDTDQAKIRAQLCHDRHCPRCGSAASLQIADVVAQQVTTRKTLHVVLTMKHNTAPLPDQVTRLFTAFKTLRSRPVWIGRRQLRPGRVPRICSTKQRRRRWMDARRRLTFDWRKHTPGGCTFLQVHSSHRDGLWHVHFHSIAEGTWINARELARAWKRLTGDSDNVSVTKVPNAHAAAREVSRYVARPIDADTLRVPQLAAELMRGLDGRKLCFTWGSWRGIKLKTPPPEPDGDDWIRLGSYNDVLARSQAGESLAKHALQLIHTRKFGERGPPSALAHTLGLTSPQPNP